MGSGGDKIRLLPVVFGDRRDSLRSDETADQKKRQYPQDIHPQKEQKPFRFLPFQFRNVREQGTVKIEDFCMVEE